MVLIEFNVAIQLLRLHLGGRGSAKIQTYANKEWGGVISMRTFAYKCF